MAVAKRVVLLDIEGTICPISFVKETLFPYALHALPPFLATHFPQHPLISAFPPGPHLSTPALFLSHFAHLTSTNSLCPAFKALQAHLLSAGYASRALTTPLFADVAPALRYWTEERGLRVAIYSAGSVQAQKMVLGRVAGEGEDVTGGVSGWWDGRNAGAKGEAGSYGVVARGMGVAPREMVFFSDGVVEVEAARRAGVHAALVVRPGNAAVSEEDRERLNAVEGFGSVEGMNERGGRDGLGFVEAWLQGAGRTET